MNRSRREKRTMTLAIDRVLDEAYADLPIPANPIIEMFVINLRNRPLTTFNLATLSRSMLSLYHNLVTGTKEFPLISSDSIHTSSVIRTPFHYSTQCHRENMEPSALLLEPAGLVMPTGGSRGSTPSFRTPLHPEKANLKALKADRMNCVHDFESLGMCFSRVFAPVYGADGNDMNNYWRVTDYNSDGHILMSVLCRFFKKIAHFAAKQRERSRSSSSSSLSSQKIQRLRL